MKFKKQLVRLLFSLLILIICLPLFFNKTIEEFKTPDDIIGSIKVPPLRAFLPLLAVPLYTATPRFIVNVPLTPFMAPLWKPEPSITLRQFRTPSLLASQNQGECGACWAFALTDQLSTFLIYKDIKRIGLSSQFFLNCYNRKGCLGDSPEKAALWVMQTKQLIPSISQLPFDSTTGVVSRNCDNTIGLVGINAVYSLCEYQPEDRYDRRVIRSNMERMKQAILTFGSIYACMSIREEFFSFLGDIPYKPSLNSAIIGGHAIQIIGYTEKTWICRGAWPEWPLLATIPNEFQLWMGANYCGIESRCGVAIPFVNNDVPV